MKTIYINGVMTDRSGVFLKMLARKFKVAGRGLSALARGADFNFIDPLSVAGKPTPDQVRDLGNRIVQQTEILAQSLAGDLAFAGLSSSLDGQLSPAEITANLLPRVKYLLHMELDFRNFLDRHPIDFMISGSDYSSHSRPLVLVARELGIPTMNLEHGFFFSRFNTKYTGADGNLPTFFTSEFANLDNDLEVEVFQHEATFYPTRDTKFLALGTPVEAVASSCLDKQEALEILGLSGNKKHVLLLGSWIEARTVASLAKGQIDTIDAYEDLFRALSASDLRHDLELLIKVHPADAAPDVFPGVKAGLENLAVGFGLPQPLVFADKLPEILSASDVVVAMGFSSVLFDVFQLGKPSIVVTPKFQLPSLDDKWRTGINIPLQAGVMAAAKDGADAWAKVGACWEPGAQEELASAIARLSERYGLEQRSVVEKSEEIIRWVEGYLGGGD